MSIASTILRFIRSRRNSPGRYSRILTRLENSRAYAGVCEQVHGTNLCQLNSATMVQLQALIDAMALHEGALAADLGCGTGVITEFVADATGAQFLGLDFAKAAIKQAAARTSEHRDRVRFEKVNIAGLNLPEHSVDAIMAIDSLYGLQFPDDVVERICLALKPRGRFVTLYTDRQGAGPDDTVPARALRHHQVAYQVTDFTDEETAFWPRLHEALVQARDQFLAEHARGLYLARKLEARGMAVLAREKRLRRYLYCAEKSVAQP